MHIDHCGKVLPLDAANAASTDADKRRTKNYTYIGEDLLRRLIDITVATLALALLFPLLVLVAAAIRLDSRGHVLFSQLRCGCGNRPFRLLKFRTMTVDAEERLPLVLAASPEARAEYERYHKLTSDPRMTRVGAVLRRLSIDELPQLVNVIRGDMTLVGPRPYLLRERECIGAALPLVLSVPPGITGLWQITARNGCSFNDRVAIDCEYVRQRSLKFDLALLIATIPVVLRGHDAH